MSNQPANEIGGQLGLLTIREIAELFGCSRPFVYRLAQEHGWQRYALSRRFVRYSRDDVLATLESTRNNS